MKNLLKKIILVFCTSFLLLNSSLPIAAAVHAQTWYNQNPMEWYLKVYDENVSPSNEVFGERYTAAQVQWIIWSLLFMPIRMAENVVGEDSILCLFKAVGTGTVDLNNCVGALGDFIEKAINPLFAASNNNVPFIAKVFDTNERGISGIGYTRELLKKFNPVTEVKAQGFGYSGLTWIQKYWKGFRDISYVLLVLVVIIIAFMVMFRVKLNPQTVISVQSALPKVIIALILITFSYAIAGFAIDLMYVVSGLIALLLNTAGFSGSNLTATYGVIAGTGGGYSFLGGLWVLFMMLAYTIMFIITAFFALLTTILTALNIFGALLAIVFIIIGVLCLLIMIWYTIKIPYVLLKTLISLYITIITAPLQIMAGTIIPSMGFGAWFKKLISDILVFPLVGLFFWFAWSTLWSAWAAMGFDWGSSFLDITTFHEPSWVPGIIGTTLNPGVHGISAIIFLGMSFGIIIMIPKIPNIIKQFMTGEKFQGTGLGEAMNAASTVGGVALQYRKGIEDNTLPRRIGRFNAERWSDRLKWLANIPKF